MVCLQDVLENEQMKLDNMFKFSLMQDIVRVRLLTYLELILSDPSVSKHKTLVADQADGSASK